MATYWRLGDGNWNNGALWSIVGSGGAPAGAVPNNVVDDVIFDNLSGNAAILAAETFDVRGLDISNYAAAKQISIAATGLLRTNGVWNYGGAPTNLTFLTGAGTVEGVGNTIGGPNGFTCGGNLIMHSSGAGSVSLIGNVGLAELNIDLGCAAVMTNATGISTGVACSGTISGNTVAVSVGGTGTFSGLSMDGGNFRGTTKVGAWTNSLINGADGLACTCAVTATCNRSSLIGENLGISGNGFTTLNSNAGTNSLYSTPSIITFNSSGTAITNSDATAAATIVQANCAGTCQFNTSLGTIAITTINVSADALITLGAGAIGTVNWTVTAMTVANRILSTGGVITTVNVIGTVPATSALWIDVDDASIATVNIADALRVGLYKSQNNAALVSALNITACSGPHTIDLGSGGRAFLVGTSFSIVGSTKNLTLIGAVTYNGTEANSSFNGVIVATSDASGGNPIYAMVACVDSGGNSNWIFEDAYEDKPAVMPASNKVTTLLGRCLRLGVKPESQGQGWSVYDGTDWLWPEPFAKPMVIYDINDLPRYCVFREKTGRLMELGTRNGPTGSGLSTVYTDLTYAAVASEITCALTLGEHTGEREYQLLDMLDGHLRFRPEGSASYRAGFEVQLESFIDGSTTRVSRISEVPMDSDVKHDRNTAVSGRRVQHKVTMATSGFRIPSFDFIYNKQDLEVGRTTMGEQDWQTELCQPVLWVTRGPNPLINRATGVTCAGSYASLITGPDTKATSAMRFAAGQGVDTPVAAQTAAWTCLFFIHGAAAVDRNPVEWTGGRIRIELAGAIWNLVFTDGVNTITQNMNWDGMAWMQVAVVRSGGNILVYKNGVLLSTNVAAAVAVFGASTTVMDNEVGDIHDVRIYDAVISADAIEYHYIDVTENDGDALLPLW